MINISFQEKDIYTQETFNTLCQTQIKGNQRFYLARIKCRDCFYDYYASYFLQNWFMTHTPLLNPLTQEKIESFKILEFCPESSILKECFEQVFALKKINYLQIFASDLSRTVEERGRFYFLLGECYRKGDDCEADEYQARRYYESAALLGDTKGQNNLAILLRKTGEKKEALYWFCKACYMKPLNFNQYLQLAYDFEDCGLEAEALICYQAAALENHPFAIEKLQHHKKSDLIENQTVENLLASIV